MQVMGRHWDETTLFRLALAAEKRLERRKPQLFFDLLR
jgi:Asp-tRNA(Asn)/Glu-tRNA(Gln) amidotransferase A subunit family amidase